MSEDRRIRKTKKSIKDCLVELLKDNPINKISVTQLTEMADISRKTFYLHYNSIFDAKNDIDNDIIVLLNNIISALPNSMNEIDIMSFFQEINIKTKSHKQLVTYFLQNSKQSTLYIKVKKALKDAILLRLENDHKNNIHNEYIVEYVVSGILNSFVEWNTKQDISAEELVVLLTNLCASASYLLVSNS